VTDSPEEKPPLCDGGEVAGSQRAHVSEQHHDTADHHDEGGSHQHGINVNADRRYLRIALLLLVAFMVTEVVVAIFSGSLALLSDAGHMLSDVGAIGASLWAISLAARPAKGPGPTDGSEPKFCRRPETASRCSSSAASSPSRPSDA